MRGEQLHAEREAALANQPVGSAIAVVTAAAAAASASVVPVVVASTPQSRAVEAPLAIQ